MVSRFVASTFLAFLAMPALACMFLFDDPTKELEEDAHLLDEIGCAPSHVKIIRFYKASQLEAALTEIESLEGEKKREGQILELKSIIFYKLGRYQDALVASSASMSAQTTCVLKNFCEIFPGADDLLVQYRHATFLAAADQPKEAARLRETTDKEFFEHCFAFVLDEVHCRELRYRFEQDMYFH